MINVAGPVYHRWCHSWAGGSAFCKIVGGAKHLKEVSKGKFLLDLCFGSCLQLPALIEFLSQLPSPVDHDQKVLSQRNPPPPQVAFGFVPAIEEKLGQIFQATQSNFLNLVLGSCIKIL